MRASVHPLFVARVNASVWPLDSVHILIVDVFNVHGHALVKPHACEIYSPLL